MENSSQDKILIFCLWQGLKPSIAAVVASMDPRALSNYEVQVRVQSTEQNEEIIQDMKNITVRMLKSFYRRNNGEYFTLLGRFFSSDGP